MRSIVPAARRLPVHIYAHLSSSFAPETCRVRFARLALPPGAVGGGGGATSSSSLAPGSAGFAGIARDQESVRTHKERD